MPLKGSSLVRVPSRPIPMMTYLYFSMVRSFAVGLLGLAVLLTGFAHRSRAADTPEKPVLAVIDSRPPTLHEIFKLEFDSALSSALSGAAVRVEVKYENPDPANIAAAVSRLEAFAPRVYYATNSDIAKKVRAINPRVPIVFS